MRRDLRNAFGLSMRRAWPTSLAVAAGLVALVAVYAHFLFWSTVLSLHFG